MPGLLSFVKKLFAPVVFGLSAVLLVASCDDLTEPVAITPDDMRPAIVTELSQQVEEDGSLVIEVQAEDPNGETMTLSITTIPQNGTAVLESSAPPLASLKTARQDDHPPAHQPETLRPEKIDTPDPDAQLQQNSNAATDRRLEATTTELPPANKTSSNSKGLSAELRIIHGAERQSATPQSDVVGRIRYTPEADFNGTDRFAFSVRNARGFASEAEVTVTVQAEPDAPRVHRGLDDINLRPGQRFTLNLRTENVFQDPDGESLTFSATSRDEAIATAEVLNDEVLTVQALNAPNQTTLIDVTATDPPGLTSATSFTVTVEAADNQPPRIAVPIADRALAIGETFEVDLVSVFVDEDGDDLTFSASSGNPGTAQAEIVAPSTLKVTMLTTGAATISVSASDGIVSIQTT
ncbi:MAG: Ig-like domain-containing protein, partial [Rhodothermales bacterium]